MGWQKFVEKILMTTTNRENARWWKVMNPDCVEQALDEIKYAKELFKEAKSYFIPKLQAQVKDQVKEEYLYGAAGFAGHIAEMMSSELVTRFPLNKDAIGPFWRMSLGWVSDQIETFRSLLPQ